MATETVRRRRHYRAELKQQVLLECTEPGASVAQVAMAHGINANIVHSWRKLAREANLPSPAVQFVPVTVAPAESTPDRQIDLELRRGPLAVNALLKRLKFAAQSERFTPEQRSLLEDEIEADLAAVELEIDQLAPEVDRQGKKQPKRQPLPANLPRREIRHEPESTTCRCGCQMSRIGEDVAEKLDYVPGTFSVERHIRSKWACAKCEAITQAPVAPHIIDKGIPTAGLLAQVYALVDAHRLAYGVESICRVLQIAPSGYWLHVQRQRQPSRRSQRAKRDEHLMPHIERIWHANHGVYGARKVWRQMLREGIAVARCTIERLMARLGLRGVMRGKAVRTTIGDPKAPCPLDRVNRQFQAERPNQLWVSDFTYVSTWQGWLYVAFVIDVFARRIVGWRVASTMSTDFVLDALEQALYARQGEREGQLVHHSDRGSQYVSIRYSERLAEAGVEPSVGSKGDSYDNALAETINGLYKAEVIRRRGPWKTREAVELATLEWVAWFNNHRLMAALDYVPPAEFEANYYRNLEQQTIPV